MSQERSPGGSGRTAGADGAEGAAGAKGAEGAAGAESPKGAEGADGGEDGIGPPAAVDPGGYGDRWWSRQLVLSITALAVMAALTLTLVVQQSPAAKAGGRPVAETEPTASAPAPPPGTAISPPPTAPPFTPSPAVSLPSGPSASSSPGSPSTTAPPASSAAESSPGTPGDPTAALAQAMTHVPGSGTGNLSVAVADLDGGPTAGFDSDSHDTAYDTASIVKVDILATLLLQHQHAGTSLTSGQRNLATSMIEVSDNDAALALWNTIGRAAGLAAANAKLGLHHTTGGAGDLWGLTQTTASDQVALLRAVFDPDGSPLTAASRDYIDSLMTSVSAGQEWGVSAADSDNAGFAIKNGWLQRTVTGLWDVNSVGLVTYEGHHLLVAVLSSGRHTEQKGIDLVEAAAVAAAAAFTGDPA